MKSRKWWFMFPDSAQASDMTFDEPVTQEEVRAYLRRWLSDDGEEVERLPRGTEVWPCSGEKMVLPEGLGVWPG